MLLQPLTVAGVLLTTLVAAQSNLYPNVNATILANAFNISSGCLTALNTTVNCDQTLLTMSGTVDDYLWNIDNVTALCTSSCLSSTQSWYSAVNSSCANDYLNFQGRLVPPLTIPGRTLDGLNIACLTPTTNVTNDFGVAASVLNITTICPNGTVFNFPTNCGDGTVFNYTDTSNSASAMSKRQSSSSSGYCLIDSYNWVGQDIIRPDCSLSSNANASQCLDSTDVPPENSRIANLYPNSLLCSTCFVNMFYLRMASPFLADTDHSDFLVYQYYDIIETCNITNMPGLIIRDTPDYEDAPGVTDGLPTNSTMQPFTVPTTSSNGTCAGQNITLAQITALVGNGSNAHDSNFNLCNVLSPTFNVSSGDLYQAFQNYDCSIGAPNTSSWCLPQGCTVYNVTTNSTCDQLVASVSTAKNNITTQQLITYNRNFQGTCDSLVPQYVCLTPPGGAYIPPSVNASATNANQQQRGGGDGSSTGNTTTTGTGNPVVSVAAGGTPPKPIQSGVIAGCTLYSNASAGDTCYNFAQVHNVTSDNLYAWNSVLGAAGGQCPTQFWSGYFYCIGTNATKPTPSATPSSVPSGSPVPSPTQSGIISSCFKYAKAMSGDTCTSFASNQGIGVSQLYTWNTQLGAGGSNCTTEFWAGYYYCVGAPTASSTTGPSGTPAMVIPSPTQSGIAPNCNHYFEAKTGDTCYSFAQQNGITANNLYAWNTVLGANGQNCSTSFYANYYYCIGVSNSSSTTTTSTATAHKRWFALGSEATDVPATQTVGSGSAPSPTQSGIVSNCDKFSEAKSGDTCVSFASENDITAANLYKWNTQLGKNGEKCSTELFAGYYYCVGVKSAKMRRWGSWIMA